MNDDDEIQEYSSSLGGSKEESDNRGETEISAKKENVEHLEDDADGRGKGKGHFGDLKRRDMDKDDVQMDRDGIENSGIDIENNSNSNAQNESATIEVRSESACDDDDNDDDDDDSEANNEEEKEEKEEDENTSDESKIHIDEHGRKLSAYEIMRLERIQRNKAYLAQLGLEEEKSGVRSSYEKEALQKKRDRKRKSINDEAQVIERRKTMARKSKTKEVDYSGDLINLLKPAKTEKPKPKPKDNARKPQKSRSEALPRHIYLEFERIKKSRNKDVAIAKRHVKASELEYRIAKRSLDIHERKEKRKRRKEEKRLLLEKANKDRNELVPLLNELNMRRGELMKLRRDFAIRQDRAATAAKQQEVSLNAACTDAKIGFPSALQRNERLLGFILQERLPPNTTIDNNPSKLDPRSEKVSKRKRKENKGKSELKSLEQVDDQNPSSANKCLKNSKATSNSKKSNTSKNNSAALEKDDETLMKSPKKSSHVTKARNVGGPITKNLSSYVQRKWLEKDSPVAAKACTSFVPQVGDIMLYYPYAHNEFLKDYPDTRCVKSKLTLRKPLWQRAKDERESAKASENNEEKKSKNSGNGKPWWSEGWVRSFDGKAGKYPILCRVEKVVAEFPYDEESIKEVRRLKYQSKKSASGATLKGDTTKLSSDKKRRLVQRNKPSLGLSVTLRPLSNIMPPKLSNKKKEFFEESKFSLPPLFSVLTFPCEKDPFLVPFFFTYRLSLSNGERVKVTSDDHNNQKMGTIVSSSISRKIDTSSSLDLFLEIMKKDAGSDLSTVNLLDQYISTCYDVGSSVSNTYIPEDDLRSVIAVALYQCHKRRRSEIETETLSSHVTERKTSNQLKNPSSITNLMNWVLLTLPCWEGVELELDEGKTQYNTSPWKVVTVIDHQETIQKNILAAALAPSVLINSSSANNGGLIYRLDEDLRVEIEQLIGQFTQSNEKAEMFIKPVTESFAPEYSRFVPLNMSFRRIFRRLKVRQMIMPKQMRDDEDPTEDQSSENTKCCYYRNVGAILSDITDIYQNCLLYNAPDSEIVKDALDLTNHLKTLICNVKASYLKKKSEVSRQAREAELVASGEVGHFVSEETIKDSSRIENFDENFDADLSREWLSGKNTTACDSVRHALLTDSKDCDPLKNWIPQCGDKIIYNRQLHGNFVNGHFGGLSKQQRILPAILPRQKKSRTIDKTTKGGESKINGESAAEFTDKDQYWLGTIEWVKACFPPLPTSNSKAFDVDAPILAIAIQFHYNWLLGKGSVLYWRPCHVTHTNNICTGNHVERTCERCGLSLNRSFLSPAWLGPTDKIIPPFPISLTRAVHTPLGIPLQSRIRIDKCIEVLKQRIVEKIELDSFTPSSRMTRSFELQNLPSRFHHIFHDEDEDNREACKDASVTATALNLLREVAFIPPWTSTKNDISNKSVTTRANAIVARDLHEILLTDPYVCLQSIQKRIKSGHYRDLIAAAHDIREAFVTSTMYILKAKIKRKQITEDSARRILLRIIPETKNNPQGKCEESTFKDNVNDSVASEDLNRKEKHIFERILSIRKIHAIALVCLFETATAETAFGVDVHQYRPKLDEIPEEQVKANEKIGKILDSIGHDRCQFRKPLSKASSLPTVHVKIKLDPRSISVDKSIFSITRQNRNIASCLSEMNNDSGSYALQLTSNQSDNNPSLRRPVNIQIKLNSMENDDIKPPIVLNPDDYVNNQDLVVALFQPHIETVVPVKMNVKDDDSRNVDDSINCASTTLGTPNIISLHNSIAISNQEENDFTLDTTKPIIFVPSDYINNDELIQAFFCQAQRKDVCAWCKLNRNNVFTCRVRKAHSNFDFIWAEYIKSIGGVDKLKEDLIPPRSSSYSKHVEVECNNENQEVADTTDACDNRALNGQVEKNMVQNSVSDNRALNEVVDNNYVTDNRVNGDEASATVTVFAKENADSTEIIPLDQHESFPPNDISPHEVFSRAERVLNLAQDSLRNAENTAASKLCLSEDYLNACNLLDPNDGHYEICIICGLGGDILCCEKCPIVAHAICVGLDEVPDGDWYCTKCKGNCDKDESNFNLKDPASLNIDELLEELRSFRQREKAEISSKKDEVSEEDKITVGTKVMKRSVFDYIGEVTSLPKKGSIFYEVRYEDGEVEKMELDDVIEIKDMYKRRRADDESSDIEYFDSNIDRPRRRRKQSMASADAQKSKRSKTSSIEAFSPLKDELSSNSTVINEKNNNVKCSSLMSRKRGRPRKFEASVYCFDPNDENNNTSSINATLRKRGRPRKSEASVNSTDQNNKMKSSNATPRKRGRPRKSEESVNSTNQNEKAQSSNASPRKRGRPRKSEAYVNFFDLNDRNDKARSTNATPRKRGRPKKATDSSSKSLSQAVSSVENLQWDARAGYVDPTFNYYCTVENDTSVTIARKTGSEWYDIANVPENMERFPSLQNKKIRFRKGTLVRLPSNCKLVDLMNLIE